jgi:hypothetical protein
MIKRLRPKYTEQQLKQIYAKPHDAKNWHDHLIRVAQTAELVKWICLDESVKIGADLSCGNANIANSTPMHIGWHLGDYAPGYEYTGPIEETIKQIPNVDIFILSETLEHLDDPGKVLWEIRQKTKHLVLSTPDDAGDDPNLEHYWSWNSDDIKAMLKDVGFEPFVLNKLQLVEYLYDYQIWGCR